LLKWKALAFVDWPVSEGEWMGRCTFTICLIAYLLFAGGMGTAYAQKPQLPVPVDHRVDFHREVLPILANRCATCHASGRSEGGLSVETRSSLLKGSDSGPVVVAGKSAESLLIELVSSDDRDLVMPKQGKQLSGEEIAILRAWIDQGVAWDADVSLRKLTMQSWQPRAVALPPATAGNRQPIDRILAPYFATHQVDQTATVDDRTFARRVYYDLGGLPPTPDELQGFLNDGPDRRARLVRHLLDDRPRYAQHWLTFWNDLLRNDYAGTGYIDGGREQITPWLYASLENNKPLDVFVRELIEPAPGAGGFVNGIIWRGAVNASQRPPLQAAQNVSQVFLGINLKCASCHDSFISSWKLHDAYALASVFSDQPLELFRCDKATGDIAQPQFLNPEIGQIDPAMDRGKRQQDLARLITSADNARLRRTIVNRFWARFFGRGLIEPIDEIDNPAWNEQVLDWLAADLQEHGDDLKHAMEQMLTSRAYQMPSVDGEPSESRDYVFSGPHVKRQTAEQFIDTIWMVTGTAPEKADAPIPGALGAGSGMPPYGKWIWSYADASSAKPRAGEQITLRQKLALPSAPKSAQVVVTCDNEYTLWVNGRKLAGDDDWMTVERVNLAEALRSGENEIVLLARNLGSSPNPAGLFLAGEIAFDQPKSLRIASDDTWEWTAASPDKNGVVSGDPQWKPAAVLKNQGFLGNDVNGRIAKMLAPQEAEPSRPQDFIRASLVVADPLMRALGRPNREQVVTTRPDVLTTLEALDLTNGATLTSLLDRGAANLLTANPNWSVDQAIDFTYVQFLSRGASAEERRIARELTGDSLTAAGLSDLLWTVLMLPEFQLIY
jgi:mono/diheme cytochrome c family protein